MPFFDLAPRLLLDFPPRPRVVPRPRLEPLEAGAERGGGAPPGFGQAADLYLESGALQL